MVLDYVLYTWDKQLFVLGDKNYLANPFSEVSSDSEKCECQLNLHALHVDVFTICAWHYFDFFVKKSEWTPW